MPKNNSGPEKLARIFAALGDESRLRLVQRLLVGGACSITLLSADMAISRQAVTKHLQTLEMAGLVRAERQGREHLYRLEPDQIAYAKACLEEIGRRWQSALQRLKDHVEGGQA